MLFTSRDLQEDIERFNEDEKAYMEEYREQGEKAMLRRKELMGEEFTEVPKPTKQECEENIENRKKRIDRLRELGAGDIILDSEISILRKKEKDLDEGDYSKTDAELTYMIKYYERESEVEKQMILER